jgi:predicted membrane-bound spermidine synthase
MPEDMPPPAVETAPISAADARIALVCAVFFLSGAAALLFENVWFRKAGLVFGNGVWASSLVLASFMAGLALGNALAARWAGRTRRPLLAYAAAETVVGAAGVFLVLALPTLPARLAPLLRPFLDTPLVLNPLRLGLAFALIAAVTTAMGTTLPLLAHALGRSRAGFGAVLGRLYGWNTLGATAGALLGEAWLYRVVGVRTTGLLAGGLSLLAATLGAALARGIPPRPPGGEPAPASGLGWDARRLLLAAALCGAVVLALEVVWWRFLQLFVSGSSRAFAVLLAAVLVGIGAGGLLAGGLLRRRPEACEWLPALAFTAGWVVLAGYATFGDVRRAVKGDTLATDWRGALVLGGFLAFPPALVSGALFTFIAAALARRGVAPARATAVATLANTLGAMAGAVAGGFLLLPGLGMERSFAVLGLLYGAVAFLVPSATRRRPATLAAAAAFLVFAALFPFGLMAHSYLLIPLARHMGPGVTLESFREGLTETIAYLAMRRGPAVIEHRLITNDYSMSATGFLGRRYMKLFVYLPVALHPAPRRALLISYGVGSTARALADTRELETIDVVDISRDILDMSAVVFPDPAANPLRDPRVRVHVEDGRYFLQTTGERFDLITAEPPPPKMAGVVNLYSREYFELVRERLAPGGFATYWLPLHSLEPDDARAIIGAFCAAFDDCTLWKGMALSWMLVGTGGVSPTSGVKGTSPAAVGEERFTAQWADPVVGPELRDLGFERPEQMGALFVAGAQDLRREVGTVAPLADDFPCRLAPIRPITVPLWYVPLGEVDAARTRFERSPWVERLWPLGLRQRTPAWFQPQRYYDQMTQWSRANSWDDIHAVLTETTLQTLPMLMLGSDPDQQRAAAELGGSGERSVFVLGHRAIRALAERRFAEAAAEARAALRLQPGDSHLRSLAAYALAIEGRTPEARALLAAPAQLDPGFDDFCARTFGR